VSLYVVFRNISNLAPVSDYEWRVQANEVVVAQGTIRGHRRSDGWLELLRKLYDGQPKVDVVKTVDAAVDRFVAQGSPFQPHVKALKKPARRKKK